MRIITNAILTSLLTFSATSAQESGLIAEEIIARANDLMNQPVVKADVKLIITTSSGDKRDFQFESYAKDKGEKSLMVYTSPVRVKGQSILMLNNADDIWAYFPRTNRVRKLATHAKKQKMEGSDFSYEDMGSGDAWLNEFNSKSLGEEDINGETCYKLELVRKKDSSSGYSRLIMWIEKQKYLPLRIDYYDDNDPSLLLKRLDITDITDIEGVPTPMKMIMTDMQNNTDTIMEYESVTYKAKLDDDLFTERGMQR